MLNHVKNRKDNFSQSSPTGVHSALNKEIGSKVFGFSLSALASSVSIRARLAVMVAFSAIMLALVGMAGWNGVSQVNSSLFQVLNESLPAAEILGGLRLSQVVSVSETRAAIAWNYALYDGLQDKTSALEEARSFFTMLLKNKKDAEMRAQKYFEAYSILPKAGDEAETWKALQVHWSNYKSVDAATIQVLSQLAEANSWPQVGDLISALREQDDRAMPPIQGFEAEFSKLTEIYERHSSAIRDEGSIVRTQVTLVMGVIFVIALAGSVILGWITIMSVVGPLDRMRAAIVEVVDTKHFNKRVQVMGKDEMAQTAVSFNHLLDSLQSSLRAILNDSNKVSDAAKQMAVSATSLLSLSIKQSGAAAEIATSVEQMKGSISGISDTTYQTVLKAKESGLAAKKGAEIIRNNAEEMEDVARIVQSTGDSIEGVGKHSNTISAIVQVIRDLAEQTNLLALNAAIEAARAGENGRGFAVVADEVRKLAERTGGSARDIDKMVGAMQAASLDAVQKMESVVEQVHVGRDLSSQAVERVQFIDTHVTEVVQAVQQVSQAMAGQSSVVAGILKNADDVAQMSSEGSCTADQVASVARGLEVLAEGLRANVSQFNV